MDRAKSLAARALAKSQGLTAKDERRLNTEAAAEVAERKSIAKDKRQRRKDAKATARAAIEAGSNAAAQQRAEAASERERRERREAAAAARAAREAAT